MSETNLAEVQVVIDPSDVDSEGFVTIWNVAAKSADGDTNLTRQVASKLMGFLCKHRCPFVVASPSDMKYLDEWYERDNSILFDWKPENDRIDVMAQHAHVPAVSLPGFLETKKFKITTNYSPKRDLRIEWFTNDWCVG